MNDLRLRNSPSPTGFSPSTPIPPDVCGSGEVEGSAPPPPPADTLGTDVRPAAPDSDAGPAGTSEPPPPSGVFAPAEARTYQELLRAAREASPPDAALVRTLERIATLQPPVSSLALAVVQNHGTQPGVLDALNGALSAANPAGALDAVRRAAARTPPETELVRAALASDNPTAAVAAYTRIDRQSPALDANYRRLLVEGVATGRAGRNTEGIMSSAQATRAAEALQLLPADQRAAFDQLVTNAPSDAHRQLLLKALAARVDLLPAQAAEVLSTLTSFAGTIAPLSGHEAVLRSTMAQLPTQSRPPSEVGAGMQHFTTSCGPTTVRIGEAEADPVVAYAQHDRNAAREREMALMSANGGRTTLRAEANLGLTLQRVERSPLEKFLDTLLEIITLGFASTKTYNWDAGADVDVLRRFAGVLPSDAEHPLPTRADALAAAERLFEELDDGARHMLGLSSAQDILTRIEQMPGSLDTTDFDRQAQADIAQRRALNAFGSALFSEGTDAAMLTRVRAHARATSGSLTDQAAVYDSLRADVRTYYEASFSLTDVEAYRGAHPEASEADARRALAIGEFDTDMRGLIGTGLTPTSRQEFLLRTLHASSGSTLSEADFITAATRNRGSDGTSLGSYLGELRQETGATYSAVSVTSSAGGTKQTQLPQATLDDYQRILVEQGLDIPIRIAKRDNSSGHFMLITDARELPGPDGSPTRHFLVQDPWTGRAVWATDDEMRDGSFLRRLSPSDHRIITHVYRPSLPTPPTS